MAESLTSNARPARPPLSIVLMFIACLMMLAAFLLLSSGAVAETPPDVGHESDRGAIGCDASRAAIAGLRQAREEVIGRYVIDDEATPAEQSLDDGVRASRSGGGFATGAEVTLVVEGAPRAATAEADAARAAPSAHAPAPCTSSASDSAPSR